MTSRASGCRVSDAVGDELFELGDREANAAPDADRRELFVPDELVHGRPADREDLRNRKVELGGESKLSSGWLASCLVGDGAAQGRSFVRSNRWSNGTASVDVLKSRQRVTAGLVVVRMTAWPKMSGEHTELQEVPST